MDASKLKSLRQVIVILNQLQDPSFCRLKQVIEDRKRIWLIIDLCPGGLLFDELIQRTIISEIDTAHVLKQVLTAVLYMHDRGICHRDIKAENILLSFKDDLREVKLKGLNHSVQVEQAKIKKKMYTGISE